MLSAPDGARQLGLDGIYGDAALIAERCRHIHSVVRHYLQAFGDDPVRIFRAPGRINLRGMHVDTHGGWLNLMTHQREVIVVTGASPDGATHVVNTNTALKALAIGMDELPDVAGRPWADFIVSPEVKTRVAVAPGHWRNYIEGAWLRARQSLPAQHVGGLRIVVDSNLPQGAALSSSAALCVALLHAWFRWNDVETSNDELIIAAQDAEWYTGSRCGTCDQAAIVLGNPAAVVHVALNPKAFSTASARAIATPEDLRVLVINSYTKRSISGAEKIAYTLNRFAYSMAMEIFRHALRDAGYAEDTIAACGCLANITPEALGGHKALYAVLKQVPERILLDELRQRYALPDLDREYTRYFGDMDPNHQPREIGLRGPLLFGIAESERARHFAIAIESGNYIRAGHLMTIGHDGDRRVNPDGQAFVRRVDDAWLDQCAAKKIPIEECPGNYGASSPALDFLVDAALADGALGASLTGAGIAGTVLALCREGDAESIADGVRVAMASAAYQRVAGLEEGLVAERIMDAILVNQSPTGAGEIRRR